MKREDEEIKQKDFPRPDEKPKKKSSKKKMSQINDVDETTMEEYKPKGEVTSTEIQIQTSVDSKGKKIVNKKKITREIKDGKEEETSDFGGDRASVCSSTAE
uniref:Uncharacterized protein n=1 Tax=Cacopsylla melanoneura TaxID=428564 RepID=A0A8D8ZUH4_9HEMI